MAAVYLSLALRGFFFRSKETTVVTALLLLVTLSLLLYPRYLTVVAVITALPWIWESFSSSTHPPYAVITPAAPVLVVGAHLPKVVCGSAEVDMSGMSK